MAEKRAANPMKVVTEKVRFSYVHLFEAFAFEEGDEKKFSVKILIDKSDKLTMGRIASAIKAVKEDERSLKKWGGKVPKKLDLPFVDCDEDEDLIEKNPEVAGCYAINIKNTIRPGVVDKNLNPIDDPLEVYSGCYGRASFVLFGYNTKGNVGIAASLNNVIKLEDGEPLSAAQSSAQDDFADFVDANAPEEDDDPLAGL